jgi:phosphoribosyl-ATP pyrophosphohydrolase
MTHAVEKLWKAIEGRRGADPGTSYTAKLLKAGVPKAAQKMGEEAVETAIAAVAQDEKAVVAESADLLYHLLVLWAARGIDPDRVWRELERRAGTSGIAEKASRKEG